jgi:hypothetical protein
LANWQQTVAGIASALRRRTRGVMDPYVAAARPATSTGKMPKHKLAESLRN